MKNKLVQRSNAALATLKKSQEILKHILSPLEQAALTNNYRPFIYKHYGAPLYISQHSCKLLIEITCQKATLLCKIIEQESFSVGIPIKHREAFNDPRLVMALPPRLRNRLFRLRCYTLFSIMQKGRSYFEDEQKFSPASLQRLDELFAKYKCAQLFS